MFTGIVSGTGHVQRIIKSKDYTSLIIKAPKAFLEIYLKVLASLLMGSALL